MLTRSQIIFLSDFNEARLQNLAQRGFIDRLTPDAYEDRAAVDDAGPINVYRRRIYWPMHALNLRLYAELTRDGGISIDLATSIVESVRFMILSEMRRLKSREAEIWAGAMFFNPEGRAHFCTTIEGIASLLSPTSDGPGKDGMSRVVMVNLSRCFDQVEAAARKINLALDWTK